MISPWTIYQQTKESSLSLQKRKKGKGSPNKNQKKLKKSFDKQAQQQNDLSLQKESTGDKDDTAIEQGKQLSSCKIDEQAEQGVEHNNIEREQNKILGIQENKKDQNKKIIHQQQQLFNLHQESQLISNEQRSKQFLKNIIQGPLIGHLDNNKLLDFCKHQANSEFFPFSPKNRRSITNHMLIQSQKISTTNEINSLVLLKCIKESLRAEVDLQRQADSNIEEVLEKLSYEFRPRVNEHEVLLEKLLKNEQEKIMKKISGEKKERKKQSVHQDEKSEESKKPLKSTSKVLPSKQNHQQLLSSLKQDIDKSSIIKYLNESELDYLNDQMTKKKTKHVYISGSRQEIKTINLNINNQKITQKLIYIGKKPVNQRLSQEASNKVDEQTNQMSQDPRSKQAIHESDQHQNPQIQQSQRQRKNKSKKLIQNMIKQHMAVRQSRKYSKQGKNHETIDKLEVQIRKLKGKNSKSSVSTLSPTEQSNLISPRVKKSLTLISSMENEQKKHNHKRHSNNLSFSSPLLPPEFELPLIMCPSPSKHNLSSSSKLLELITNNIIISRNSKSLKRNSTQNPQKANNLLNQMFVKDKQKKLVMMRRNQSINGKGKNSQTKEILRQVNRKKLLSLDQQIKELKHMESKMALDQEEIGTKNDQLTEDNEILTPSKRKHKKIFPPNDEHQAFNFMRKRPHQHKLTSLQTELISLAAQENKQPQDNNQSHQEQMNSSTIKFSDHQIIHDMNLMPNAQR